MPVPDTIVTAFSNGIPAAETKSDSSGYFRLTLPSHSPLPGQTTMLSFKHVNYKPLKIDVTSPNQIFLAHLAPIPASTPVAPVPQGPEVPVSNLRVRYSVKAIARVDVGGMPKIFEVVNTADVPCQGHPPCSPDGLWKANVTTVTLDAGQGNQFRDDRVSCVAGPCPFTRIVAEQTSHDGRHSADFRPGLVRYSHFLD